MKFGWRVRDARRRNGLTQGDLAARSGIPQSTISLLEQDKVRPTWNQAVRFARALRLPLQWFLDGELRAAEDIGDLAFELHHLGLTDLHIGAEKVPGAFRPTEQVLSLLVRGNRPDPRLIEGLPALLAWNAWQPKLLLAYAEVQDRRGPVRLAWSADIALTLQAGKGFPGGCPAAGRLEEFTALIARPEAPDDLGSPAGRGTHLPPSWRRWRITYGATLEDFRARAESLAHSKMSHV